MSGVVGLKYGVMSISTFDHIYDGLDQGEIFTRVSLIILLLTSFH